MPTDKPDKPKAAYLVVNGINYPPNKRADRGDVVDDLPGESIKQLLKAGHIVKDGEPLPPGREALVADRLVRHTVIGKETA